MEPRLQFEKSLVLRGNDVSPDGHRFVMIEEGESEQRQIVMKLLRVPRIKGNPSDPGS